MLPIRTVKKGRLHGTVRLWHKNGQLKSEDSFHKGRLHGLKRRWYSNGQLKSEIQYVNGACEGRRQEWYKDGRLMFECFFIGNKLDGPSIEWFPNAQIQESGHYLKGKRHGFWKEFDSKGKLFLKQIYVQGVVVTGKTQELLNKKYLKAQDITNVQCAVVRRILLEELGYERFLKGIDYEVIDSDKERLLIRADWHKDEEDLYLVKVRCPSTEVYYTLRVPPSVKTVHEAVAWTFGLTEEEYQPQEET